MESLIFACMNNYHFKTLRKQGLANKDASPFPCCFVAVVVVAVVVIVVVVAVVGMHMSINQSCSLSISRNRQNIEFWRI